MYFIVVVETVASLLKKHFFLNSSLTKTTMGNNRVLVVVLSLSVLLIFVGFTVFRPVVEPVAPVVVAPPTPIQPASATVVSPISIKPGVITMAPTTTTIPGTAATVFEPVLSTQDKEVWKTPPFPEYALLNATSTGHKADVYLEDPSPYPNQPGKRLVTVWWQDVPETVDALYLVYDRARFNFDYQGTGLALYASKDKPEEEMGLVFSIFDMVTNPTNAVEGAILIYDKLGDPFKRKRFNVLDRFIIEFYVDSVSEATSLLRAASFFYVDNGVGNFLTLSPELIRQVPPRKYHPVLNAKE
jgi:hypothetical protein